MGLIADDDVGKDDVALDAEGEGACVGGLFGLGGLCVCEGRERESESGGEELHAMDHQR